MGTLGILSIPSLCVLYEHQIDGTLHMPSWFT